MNVIVAKYIDEKLENLMQTNGLIKSKRKFESNSLFAIPYKDGLVYAPKGCRWNFGEEVSKSKISRSTLISFSLGRYWGVL
jgi:hypothetical protein